MWAQTIKLFKLVISVIFLMWLMMWGLPYPSNRLPQMVCSQNPANWLIQWGTLTFSPMAKQSGADKDNYSLSASDDQAELLQLHHCLGHLSFSILKSLDKNGEIPQQMANVKEPKCAGCLFGKMLRVPWWTRSKENNKVHEATYPGECVYDDQMHSTQAGFDAQL